MAGGQLSGVIPKLSSGIQLPSSISQLQAIRALERHVQDLTASELILFQNHPGAGPDDILRETQAFDRQQAQSSRFSRCVQRIAPFLTAITQLNNMIGSLIQYAPAPTSIVWGGILSVIQLVIAYSSYFDTIFQQFEAIGGVLRPLTEYSEAMYKDSKAVQDALAAMYGDVLKFCRVATSIFVNKRGQKKSGIRIFAHQTWKSFESEFGDLQTQFQQHVRTIEMEMQVIDRRTLHTGSARVDAYQQQSLPKLEEIRLLTIDYAKAATETKRRVILNWISTLNFRNEHEKACDSRHGTTGSWLLGDDQFVQWLNSPVSALLWCNGKAGSGKTVLASTVLANIHGAATKAGSIAFVYCDSRQKEHSLSYNLAASLLQQLCSKPDALPKAVEEMYDKLHHEGVTNMTWAELKGLLLQMPSICKDTTILFDGLDECEDCELMCELLDQLASTSTGICKLFVTSRSQNRTIRNILGKHSTIVLEDDKTAGDIRAFVDAEIEALSQSGKLSTRNPDLKHDIADALVSRADGMFLWVRFQIETLCAQSTDAEIRATLNVLPHGLDKVYQRSFEAIHQSPPAHKILAQRVLTWTLHTRRSLKIWELIEALAVVPFAVSTDAANKINDVSLVTSVCAELITIDKNMYVQFTHSSVRDFLLSPELQKSQVMSGIAIQKRLADFEIGQACLSYLLYDSMSGTRISTTEDVKAFYMGNIFIGYAVIFWSDHIRGQWEERLEGHLIRLLCREGAADFRSLWRHLIESKSIEEGFSTFMENPSPLTIAVQERLEYIITKLPDLNSEIEKENHDGYTPLMIAVRHNSVAIAKLLIARGADVCRKGPKGNTSLHYAAQSGNIDFIHVLLGGGADSKEKNNSGATIHFVAAINGHLTFLEKVLESESDTEDVKQAMSWSLEGAIAGGQNSILVRLVSMGADANAVNDLGWSPLFHAVHNNQLDMAEHLITAGANVNWQQENCSCRNVLCEAAATGSLPMVKLLLGAGAVSSAEKENATVLHWSAISGNVDVVRWALTTGIDVNHLGANTDTPLMWAADEVLKANTETIKELLQAGADVNIRSRKQGITALHYAAQHGSLETVDLLLNAGADIEARGTEGWTPLIAASQNGHLQTVERLLRAGCVVNVQDGDQKSPLIRASQWGQPHVVVALIKAKADPNAQDINGHTALYFAAIDENEEIVDSLLAAGADVNMQSNMGTTALMTISDKGFSTIAKKLIVANANVDIQNDTGASALHFAAASNRVDVVRQLVGAGASVNAQDKNSKQPAMTSVLHMLLSPVYTRNADHLKDKTPLMEAATCGDCSIIELLLSASADATLRSINQTTALNFAAANGNTEVVKKLLSIDGTIDCQNVHGLTALHEAVLCGHSDTVNVLLQAGADVSLPACIDGTAQTVLQTAVTEKRLNIVKDLLQHGAQPTPGLLNLLQHAAIVGATDLASLFLTMYDVDAATENGNTPLILAAETGFADTVELLLDSGANPNHINSIGGSALFLATLGGFDHIVELLCSRGAAVTIKLPDNTSVLHYAAAIGNEQIVSTLLDRGCEIDTVNDEGLSPVYLAVQKNHATVVRQLCEAGADVNQSDEDGIALLERAASLGHADTVSALLEFSPNINASDRVGFTALIEATQKGYLSIVEALLAHGADVSQPCDDGWTPAAFATVSNHADALRYLIKAGCNIHQPITDTPTWTCLYLAAEDGLLEMIEILLANGGEQDLEVKAPEFATPLFLACLRGQYEAMERLMAAGADIEVTNENSWTPLHVAANFGRLDMVSLLLKAGANMSARTLKQQTALHLTAYDHTKEHVKNSEIVSALLQHQGDINARQESGSTALFLACCGGREDLVSQLLDAGADFEIPHNSEETPLHVAAVNGHENIVVSLLGRGANPNAPSNRGQTPLHFAAHSGHENIVRLLLDHSADMNIQSEIGLSPLHLATMQGHVEVVKLLLRNDADINMIDWRHRSALQMAITRGRPELTDALLAAGAEISHMDWYGRSCVDYAAIAELDIGHTSDGISCAEKQGRLTATIMYLLEKLKSTTLENFEETEDLDHLGRALLFSPDAGDWEAAICFEQRIKRKKDNGAIEHFAICNNCTDAGDIKGSRFVCRRCEDSDLCEDCYRLYDQAKLSLRQCTNHTFLKVPRDGWASLESGTVLADGTTMRQWVEKQIWKRTPPISRLSRLLAFRNKR